MRALLLAMAGLIGWAMAFSLIYGLHGLGCGLGWGAVAVGPLSLQRGVLLLAWVCSLLALGYLAWRLRGGRSFLERIAIISAVTGLVATLYTGAPVAVTSTCTGDEPTQTPA